MKKFFATLIIGAFMLTAAVAVAAVQIFDGTGQYIMSDFENHEIAQQRAKQRAERDAQKKAGVYLQTFSRSVNARLTDEEISAVTNNIIKISDVQVERTPFNVNGEVGFMYKVTLKATIDLDGIYDYIKLDDQNKVTIVEQNNRLQDAIQRNDELAASLTEQYNRATSQDERERIRRQMNDADREFLANRKNNDGLQLFYAKDYNGAIKLCNEALQFGEYAGPYNNRGIAYSSLGQYERAVADYSKAVELNPNYVVAYYNRGNAYSNLGQYERAIGDYSEALALNPNLYQAYYNRGLAYINFDRYELAIDDFNAVILLKPNYADAYYNRGVAYALTGNFGQGIADATKALELDSNHAAAYKLRGLCWQQLGDDEKAQIDFAKAEELGCNG